jgi:hypothetical protein
MYITNNSARSDGFGAQFQNIIWLIVYALNNGHTFVFSDIKNMEHNYDNDTQFINSLIEFTTIKKQFGLNTDSINANIIEMSYLYNNVSKNFNNYFQSSGFLLFKENFLKDKINPFDNAFINIVIHHRVLNTHDSDFGRKFTNINDVLNIIKYFSKLYEDKNIIFHICSQGNINNFSIISESIYNNNNNINFYLDKSIQDTFLYFIFADILITSNSSFSYTAALLSKGTVYFKLINDTHPPLNSWYILDNIVKF